MSTMGYVSTLEGATASASLSLDFEKQSYRVLEGGKQVNKGFDELLTFSRATTGGRFNEKGLYETVPANQPRFDYDPITKVLKGLLVEEQRTNLVTMSEQLGSWQNYLVTSKRAEIVSPSGTLNATKVIPTTDPSWHQLRGNVFAVTASNNYTTSVFAKKGENDIVRVTLENATLFPSNSAGVFNLSTGTVVSGAGAKIQDVGDGWYRCSVTSLCAVTGTTITALGVGSFTYVGDGVSGLYFWGAQVEMGIFATSYIPTEATFTSRSTTATYFDKTGVLRTAGLNVPRTGAYLNDQTGTLVPAGLILESASTNLLKRAGNDMGTAPWAFVGTTLTRVSGIDGGLTANKITEDVTIFVKEVRQTLAFSAAAGTTYTFSIYAKPLSVGSDRQIRIGFGNGGITSGGAQAVFNLKNHTLASVDNGTVSIQKIGDGWARYSYTVTATNTSTPSVYLTLLVLGGAGYQGDGVSGCSVYGAQVEVGASATSYIPPSGTFTSRSTTATYLDSNGLLQTAGANVARDNAYGYDNGVLKPIGLLLEPASSNLLSYSHDYVGGTAGTWSNLGPGVLPLAITPNAANGTRGPSTMTLIARQDLGVKYLSKVFSAGAGTVITRTQRVKAADSSPANTCLTMRLQTESYANRVDAWFNIGTGECSAQRIGDTELIGVSMTKEKDGVWLCTLTGKSGVGAWGSVGMSVLDRAGTTDSTPAELCSAYIDTAQLEVGRVATSYIPTTTSTVGRSVDVSNAVATTRAGDVSSSVATTRSFDKASLNNLSWYNNTESSFVTDFTSNGVGVGNAALAFRLRTAASANASAVSLYKALSSTFVGIVIDPAGAVTMQGNFTNAAPDGVRVKGSLGYKVNSGAVSVSGKPAFEDTSLVVPTPEVLHIGQNGSDSQSLNGYVHSIHYYPLRLSSPQLQIISE